MTGNINIEKSSGKHTEKQIKQHRKFRMDCHMGWGRSPYDGFKGNIPSAAGPRLIGLAGAGPSVGVTHTAVMTAGYLTGICRRRCAVLEWNGSGNFERLKEGCLGRSGGDRSGRFRLLDVDYYENAGTETLVLCKKQRYQDVIVDYGAVSGDNQKEFFRCDRQFLLAGLSEWQLGAFLETAGAWKRAGVSWETLAVFGSEETRRNMEKELGLSIRRVPVSVDAFIVTEAVMKFYQQIL